MSRRHKRAGDADAWEEAESRIGDWRKEDRYGGYWRDGDPPSDAENWVAVDHGQDSSYYGDSSSEALGKSNMAYIQSNVIDAFPDDVITEVGSGDFAIRALRPENPEDVAEGEEPTLVPTDAWTEWVGIENALENYPVLDEDDFSEREQEMSWDETKENVDYRVSRIEGFEPIDDLPKNWIGELMSYINDNIENYWDKQEGANGVDPTEEHVISGMLALHYFKRLRDYVDEDIKE